MLPVGTENSYHSNFFFAAMFMVELLRSLIYLS